MRLLALPAGLLVAGLALAGCGSGSKYQDQYFGEMDSAPTWEEETAAEEGVAEAADGGGPYSTGIDPSSAIIVSGYATVRTPTPEETAAQFAQDVVAAGGRIDNRQQSEWNGQLTVSLDVRIPPGEFDAVRSSLSSYGKVIDESTWSEDVGLEVADLSARKDALEQSIDRLQELIAGADTTEELLQAESILTERQSQLDSLNSQLQWLERQVEMSSLSVTFGSASSVDNGFSWTNAWNVLAESFRVVAYALIVAIPWAVIIGAIVLGVRALVRRRRRTTPAVQAYLAATDQTPGPGAETEEKSTQVTEEADEH